MEGPKSFAAEQPPSSGSAEGVETPLDAAESIEQALELKAEIQRINQGGDVYGPDAMKQKAHADACEAEYITVLANLSDEVRQEYQFPLRSPAEKRPEPNVVQFPKNPSHAYSELVGYTPQPSSEHPPAVDAEQKVANDNRAPWQAVA